MGCGCGLCLRISLSLPGLESGLTVSGCGSGLICVGASARLGLGQGGFGEVSLCFWSWLVRRLCGLWVWAVAALFPRRVWLGVKG